MTTLRAHFDGKVLVPDGPVDLPMDRPLELQVRDVEPNVGSEFEFPMFKVKPGAKIIRSEDIYRALDED